MGAQVAQVFPAHCSLPYLDLAYSDVATKSNESHESDEGSERCKGCKGREGSCGGHGGYSSRSVEKGWFFQDCRCAQLEAKAETGSTCAQGRQPVHERAMRLQSQASIQ